MNFIILMFALWILVIWFLLYKLPNLIYNFFTWQPTIVYKEPQRKYPYFKWFEKKHPEYNTGYWMSFIHAKRKWDSACVLCNDEKIVLYQGKELIAELKLQDVIGFEIASESGELWTQICVHYVDGKEQEGKFGIPTTYPYKGVGKVYLRFKLAHGSDVVLTISGCKYNDEFHSMYDRVSKRISAMMKAAEEEKRLPEFIGKMEALLLEEKNCMDEQQMKEIYARMKSTLESFKHEKSLKCRNRYEEYYKYYRDHKYHSYKRFRQRSEGEEIKPNEGEFVDIKWQ